MSIYVNGVAQDTSQLYSQLVAQGVDTTIAKQESSLVSGSNSETDVYIPSGSSQAQLTLYDASGNLVGTEQVSLQQRFPQGGGGAVGNFIVGYLVGKALDYAWDHRQQIVNALGYGPGKPTPPGGVPGFGPPPPPPPPPPPNPFPDPQPNPPSHTL